MTYFVILNIINVTVVAYSVTGLVRVLRASQRVQQTRLAIRTINQNAVFSTQSHRPANIGSYDYLAECEVIGGQHPFN